MTTKLEQLVQIGDAFLTEGIFAQAIEAFTMAIATDPRSALAFRGRAQAHYDRFCALGEKVPCDVDKYEEFMVKQRSSKELGLSLKDLNAAIAIAPDLPEANLTKGVVEYEMGRYRDAVRSLSRAISLEEDTVKATYHRAMAYESLGDDVRALADLDATIRLDPNYADAFLGKGVIYSVQDKCAEAVEEMDKAISLNPDKALYHCHRAMAISTPAFETMDTGALGEALDGLTTAIRLDPKYGEAYFHRSFIFGLLDDYVRELEDLTAAIHLDSDYVSAYRNRFACLVQLGKKEKAVRDWAQYCARTKQEARFDFPDGLRRTYSSN